MNVEQKVRAVKRIVECAEAEALEGLQWHADRGEYLQVQPSAGWVAGEMAGVTVGADGQIWIDGDVVAESVQDRRFEALTEAGYSSELAGSQRRGFDEQEARSLLV